MHKFHLNRLLDDKEQRAANLQKSKLLAKNTCTLGCSARKK
jgi:hypothetical protein